MALQKLEERLGCVWKKCLESEKEHFFADSSTYPIITRKEDSALYRECNGCDGRKKDCRYYRAILSKSH